MASTFIEAHEGHRWLGRLWPWLATAVLIALLATLGVMQLHWLDQVSAADEQRSRAALEGALESVALDFNRQLARVFMDLQPARGRWQLGLPLDESGSSDVNLLAPLYERYVGQAEFPELVEGLYALSFDESASPDDLASLGDLGLRLYAVDELHVSPVEVWPAHLHGVAAELERWRAERVGRRRSRQRPPALRLLHAEVPALLIPVVGRQPGDRDAPGDRRGRRRGTTPRLFLIAELDSQAIFDDVLPALVRRHLRDQVEYRLSVVARAGDGRGEVLWSLGPPSPARAVIEAEQPIFGPLVSDERPFSRWGAPFTELGVEEGQWWLRATHPAGSLVTAVQRHKNHQALIALSILAVLGLALVLATRAAVRSRRLARQQLSFVAGITHELMTPLAALRSAGQNLADGLVTDGERVARYGRMIDHEGQRLSQLVAQVLTFARLQAGPPDVHLVPLEPRRVIDDLLAEFQPTLEAEAVELSVDIDDPLPHVIADSQALGRVLVNLVSNALKYGRPTDGSPMWLGLAVSFVAAPRGRDDGRVRFEVRDHGPGIAAADRSQLFEPFVRGRGLEASHLAGSGLGLALVAHLVASQGGTVRVQPTRSVGKLAGQGQGQGPGQGRGPGATFVVELSATWRSGQESPTQESPTQESPTQESPAQTLERA